MSCKLLLLNGRLNSCVEVSIAVLLSVVGKQFQLFVWHALINHSTIYLHVDIFQIGIIILTGDV